MAVMEVSYYSKTLGMQCSMNVIVPQRNNDLEIQPRGGARAPYPVLYLLHGRSGDRNTVRRFSSLELYSQLYGTVIVIPDAFLSFYSDQVNGFSFLEFFTEELPQIVAEFFHVSTKREHTYVAGYSMGGYGALKLALKRPDKYCAAANMSGSPDIIYSMEKSPVNRDALPMIIRSSFGSIDALRGSDNDLFHLADELVKSEKPIPRLYSCVGLDDFLLEPNRRFNEAYGEDLNLSYHEEPGGHTWSFWNAQLPNVMRWLDINGR